MADFKRPLGRCKLLTCWAFEFFDQTTSLSCSLRQHPALRLVARDICGAGFSLRIEGVEILLETFFRALSRIDGATDFLHVRPCAWA